MVVDLLLAWLCVFGLLLLAQDLLHAVGLFGPHVDPDLVNAYANLTTAVGAIVIAIVLRRRM